MWTRTAFYASVEMQRHPELRDKPLAVCGSQEDRHGIVLTANYIAKPRGVKTGMAIWQARQCCPDLVVLPPDMAEYIQNGNAVDICYELNENTFNHYTSIQMMVQDIVASD